MGFPLRLGYHKPDVSEDTARTIIAGLKAPKKAVLITYETSAKALIDFCRFLGVSIVQLHGDISPEEVQRLRRERPVIFLNACRVCASEPQMLGMKSLNITGPKQFTGCTRRRRSDLLLVHVNTTS